MEIGDVLQMGDFLCRSSRQTVEEDVKSRWIVAKTGNSLRVQHARANNVPTAAFLSNLVVPVTSQYSTLSFSPESRELADETPLSRQAPPKLTAQDEKEAGAMRQVFVAKRGIVVISYIFSLGEELDAVRREAGMPIVNQIFQLIEVGILRNRDVNDCAARRLDGQRDLSFCFFFTSCGSKFGRRLGTLSWMRGSLSRCIALSFSVLQGRRRRGSCFFDTQSRRCLLPHQYIFLEGTR